MSPTERAAWLRLLAAAYEKSAAEYRFAAACTTTSAAFRALGEAMQGGYDDELARHPDMAELNVRMDALYDL